MRIENVSFKGHEPQSATAERAPVNTGRSSLASQLQITPTEKITEHFWNTWDFVKSTLLWVYDTVLWVFQGCPAEESPLDIMEDIIESPKEMAAEFAKKPAEFTADFILAVLLNPKGIKDLRDQNKGAFGDFIRACKGKVKNWKKHLSPKKDFSLEKKVFEALCGNPIILHGALSNLRDQILEVLGEEDKKGDNDNVKALRRICKGYLQKVLDHGESEPKAIGALYKALKEKSDPSGFVAIFQRHAAPKPTSAEAGDLVKVFSEKALVLRQLADPKKFFGKPYKDASPVQYPMSLDQAVFRALEPKHFETALEILDKNFALGTAVVQKIKALGTKAQVRIADNLPKALEVLKQLDKDLANPPTGKK
ncbi:MAG: hypothetical protein P0S96_07405 [Simkaniaceae bacterium]|nr:hypothetical protein [Candidatus Sacchlamyda saccharinae]